MHCDRQGSQDQANVDQHQGNVQKIEEILKNTEPNITSHGWSVNEYLVKKTMKKTF